MRNTLKTVTLESRFPLLAVEQDCIISKDADITIAFRVEITGIIHFNKRRIRSHTFGMGKGRQGTAQLLRGS